MSATNAPFGLRPAYHPSGLDRATVLAGGIPSGYANQILKGQPVKYNSSGQIVPAAAGDSFVGAFAGVEFTDSTGRYRVSNYWPASQSLATNTVATAYFYSDPLIVYEIQANGSLAQTAIGDQADLTDVTDVLQLPDCRKPDYQPLWLVQVALPKCVLWILHLILAMLGVMHSRSFV